MSIRIPVEQVAKIDLEQFIEVGIQMGYDRPDIEFTLHDCEIAREGEPITVVYRAYIGKVGPRASDEARGIIRLMLNQVFDEYPDMDRLYILDY